MIQYFSGVKLCNIVGEVKYPNAFYRGVILQIRFLPGNSNDDKRIQSIDSIETYAYGTSEDIIHVKEIIKRYNTKSLSSITFQTKNLKEHIQNGQKFLIIRIEY